MFKVIKSASAPAVTLLMLTFIGVFMASTIAGCNANASSSDTAGTATAAISTLAYYSAIEPTMTFQAGAAARAGAAQLTITALSGTQTGLTSTLNAVQTGGQQPVTANLPTANPNPGVANVTSGSTPQPAQTTPSADFGFDKIVMSKTIDAKGCAITETTTFSTADATIYVVGTARNYKKGTVFTSTWTGGDIPANTQFTWKAPSDGTSTCIYFNIQPKFFSLKAGSFNVVISATGADGTNISGVPVVFTLQ